MAFDIPTLLSIKLPTPISKTDNSPSKFDYTETWMVGGQCNREKFQGDKNLI